MRRKYFQGRPSRGADVKDIYWLDSSGREMTDEAWSAPTVRSLGVLMVGDALDEIDERGRPVRGDTLLILLNAHPEETPFTLPSIGPHTAWLRVIDTIAPRVEECRYPGGATYPLQGRTLALFVLSLERRERATSLSDPTNEPPRPN
jgi:glycogen operon protein